MERRHHDRLARPGRSQSDHRLPAADHRRILLVGTDEAWRLLTAYVFEEAGYVVYAAADQWQATAFTSRLLPDVVVLPIETPNALEILVGLSTGASTRDIPVVVLTSSLQSREACRAHEAGGVILLAHAAEVDVLVGEVEALIATRLRGQRTLKRRLLDIQELAQFYPPDKDGQHRLRCLIDRLQVALFALDAQGHCIAASQGATRLTGYSHRQLLTTSVFDAGFAGGQLSGQHWRRFLAHRHYAGTTTITNRSGEDLAVHAAAVAEIMPGVHVVALAST
jgi:PAS domain S-box-containing protein